MRYTETQMSSEILDQPLFVSAPRKLFICSTPRSGSYLLCRYMINAGLGVPHEYFNPIIMRQMAPRLGLGGAVEGLKWRARNRLDRLPFGNPARVAEENFLQNYSAALIPRRCQGGIFAAKIHYEHLLKVLDNQTGRELLDGGLFIHLYRENLLKQAVSAHFAHLTGRWSIDDTFSTVPAKQPDFFDVTVLDGLVETLAREDQGWRVFFARNGLSALSFSYEQLCKDPYSFVAAAADRVGFDPARLRRDYVEETTAPTASDPNVPSKGEVTRRYVAAFRTLRETGPQRKAAPAKMQEAGE